MINMHFKFIKYIYCKTFTPNSDSENPIQNLKVKVYKKHVTSLGMNKNLNFQINSTEYTILLMQFNHK